MPHLKESQTNQQRIFPFRENLGSNGMENGKVGRRRKCHFRLCTLLKQRLKF